MSRGLGTLQRRVLKAIEAPREMARSAGRKWAWRDLRVAGVEDFEAGRRVPVRRVRQLVQCGRAEMSRALSSLERRGLVKRYDYCLQSLNTGWGGGWPGTNTKYVGLTPEGEVEAKCIQMPNEGM